MAVPKGHIPPNKGKPMTAEQYEKCKHTFFQKGHIPANKGKKLTPELYAKAAPTMFKKGQVPHNHKPVGSESLVKEGYISVKIAEPNIWKLKHRYIWEQANGPIPPNHTLIFIDGNIKNCKLDNLMLITRAEHAQLNRLGLRAKTRETLETALNVVRLVQRKAAAKRKRGKR